MHRCPRLAVALSPTDAKIEEGNSERQDAVEAAAAVADQVQERDFAPHGLAEEAHPPEHGSDLAEPAVVGATAEYSGKIPFDAEANAARCQEGESDMRG